MRIDLELRRLALSNLLLGFVGPVPPPWLLEALADGLGGVVLFSSNLDADIAALTARLREAAGREIVIALDEEGGDVTRLDSSTGSSSPGAAALGFADDVVATERAYAEIGTRLRAAGASLNLAPVADVNNDPRNPVIGVRSFGSDAEVAARHVAAAVAGLQSVGVGACAKHFPGHGATSADSHHETATVTRTRAELEKVEFEPFRAAIAAGSAAIMTGHLIVPALDDRVATLSRRITTDVLRNELGFKGTVVTDALEMKAISATFGMVDGFVEALAAGADAVESGAQDYPELVTAIPLAVDEALRDGRLTTARLEAAAENTARLGHRPRTDERATLGEADGPATIEIIGRLPRLVRPLVVECCPPDNMASGDLPWSLAEPLAERIDDVVGRRVSQAVDLELDGRSLVLVVRSPMLYPWQYDLAKLAATQGDSVIVDVGWPDDDLLGGAPVIRTRGVAPMLMRATADALATAR